MKNKKRVVFISALVIGSLLFSSCALGKKCPAYTKADTTSQTARA
jgi:hypothetical protein